MVVFIVLLICFVVFGCIGALFVAGFYVAGSAFSGMTDVSAFETKRNKFVEELVEGGNFASNKIVIVDVKGVIMNADGGFSQIANSKTICDQLEQARNDVKVRAVILRLDTPGGEVTAADMIHHKIMQLKGENVKVVSCMESVAASGGYYIAVASDYILANRLTTTGSIGVIIETFNYQSLFNKIGLKAEVYKSGEMKDMLSGARPRTEAEKQLVQDIISEVYNEFVNIVAEGRKSKKITAEMIKTTQIGDGRIFSGQKALELGLIDGVGYFDDAIDKAAELAKIKSNYKVVTYRKVFSFSDFFMSMKGPDNKIKLDIPGMKSWTSALEPGKVYLLPSSGY
jgi:protease-4